MHGLLAEITLRNPLSFEWHRRSTFGVERFVTFFAGIQGTEDSFDGVLLGFHSDVKCACWLYSTTFYELENTYVVGY